MNMASAFATLFHKKVGCPSSQSLLEYVQSGLASSRARHIEAHLADCDFCNAELQLLNRYQKPKDECSSPEMPQHIRRLAERLLHNSAVALHPLQLAENRRI